MTASRRPRPFSSRSFVQILLVTLVLRLPAPTDACDEIPRYVSMKPKGNPVAPVSAGFTAHYECRPGYRLIVPLVRPSVTVCQADGEWAPPLQEICTRKLCPHPGDPLNGPVEGSTQFGSQVNYFCNEGYILVGNSFLRCELSGNEVAWSGDPPQCNRHPTPDETPSKTLDACDEIPRYVSMKPKGNPVAPVDVGFTAHYECRPGYRLVIPLVRPTSTVCQADGTWAPPLREACKRKSCLHPEKPVNGRVEGSSQFGSRINYSCNEGYILVGNSFLRCKLYGNYVDWSDDPPQCNKILCKPPPQIQNGEFTKSYKDTFEYNEKVIYSCKLSNGSDPYSLVGNSTLRCSGPDKWNSDPPECKEVKCEFPSVTNGKIVSGFGTKFYYKAEVEFECNEGYSLEGRPKIVCEANAAWVPEKPRCVKVVTPPPPSTTTPILSPSVSTPPSTKPPVSSVTGLELSEHLRKSKKTLSLLHGACSEKQGTRFRTYQLESQRHFRRAQCKPSPLGVRPSWFLASRSSARNMTASRGPRRAPPRRTFSARSLVGNLLVTLVLWLPAPTDACDEIPRYVSMKPKGNPVAPVDVGFTAEYECRPGYRLIVPLVRPSATVCQADGTWAPPLQEICTRKSCPHPGDPLNGRVEGSTQFGSQMNYFCNEGYNLLGNSFLRCELSGNEVNWSGDPPQCNKILCKPPPQIQNGKFSNSDKDIFEYNEVVTYSCKPSGGSDPYSLVGNSTVKCSGQDKWSSDPPECKVVRCEFPSVTNGKLVSGFGTKFYYKAEVEFECNEGYSLEGSPKIVCEANNTWVPEKPRCVKVVTPPPPSTTTPILSPSGHPTPTPDETPSKTLGGGVIAAIVIAVFTYLEQKFYIVNSLEILWDGVRSHHIVTVLCRLPQQIPNGEFTSSHKNTFEHNEIVTYRYKPSVDQVNIHWLERAGLFVLGLIDGALTLLSVKGKLTQYSWEY